MIVEPVEIGKFTTPGEAEVIASVLEANGIEHQIVMPGPYRVEPVVRVGLADAARASEVLAEALAAGGQSDTATIEPGVTGGNGAAGEPSEPEATQEDAGEPLVPVWKVLVLGVGLALVFLGFVWTRTIWQLISR